jgi:hypothetical protein
MAVDFDFFPVVGGTSFKFLACRISGQQHNIEDLLLVGFLVFFCCGLSSTGFFSFPTVSAPLKC